MEGSYLFNQVNSGLKIEAKIDEVPRDALTAVLVLFEDKHGVVEELLKLLIGVVDAQLFERVDLRSKKIKSS